MNRFPQKQTYLSDIQQKNSLCNTSTFPTVVIVDSLILSIDSLLEMFTKTLHKMRRNSIPEIF